MSFAEFKSRADRVIKEAERPYIVTPCRWSEEKRKRFVETAGEFDVILASNRPDESGQIRITESACEKFEEFKDYLIEMFGIIFTLRVHPKIEFVPSECYLVFDTTKEDRVRILETWIQKIKNEK